MQYVTLEDTVYLWFAANDTSGSGADGTTPLYDVRLGGAADSAAPTLSGTPSLLSHANYPAGCYEVAVAATAANGFAANSSYGVFCTLAVSSQNPTGFIGGFRTAPVPANVTTWLGTAPLALSSQQVQAVVPSSTVVASVTGAVGSVTGAVGSVTGAVGSVTGNVGGNVTGSVGSVVGAVGSVAAPVTVGTNNDKTGYSLTATTGLGNQTSNITGNLSGSVGSVTGAVGSVTGNVGGNVTGSVGSVVGAVGSVTGAVGSVTGNVGGNVVGSVGSVVANVTAVLANGVTHGGTTAVLVLERLRAVSTTSGQPGIYAAGSGSGAGLHAESPGLGTGAGILATGGATSPGLYATGGLNNGAGALFAAGGSGTGSGMLVSGGPSGFDFRLGSQTTNLLLAKTTNITGFNDITAAAVVAALGTGASLTSLATQVSVDDIPNNAEFAAAMALLSTNAQLVRVLAAVYDSVARSGDTLTLSNGATQVIDATGRTTSG